MFKELYSEGECKVVFDCNQKRQVVIYYQEGMDGQEIINIFVKLPSKLL